MTSEIFSDKKYFQQAKIVTVGFFHTSIIKIVIKTVVVQLDSKNLTDFAILNTFAKK